MISSEVLRWSNIIGVGFALLFFLFSFLCFYGHKPQKNWFDRVMDVLGFCFVFLGVMVVVALFRLNSLPVDDFVGTTPYYG